MSEHFVGPAPAANGSRSAMAPRASNVHLEVSPMGFRPTKKYAEGARSHVRMKFGRTKLRIVFSRQTRNLSKETRNSVHDWVTYILSYNSQLQPAFNGSNKKQKLSLNTKSTCATSGRLLYTRCALLAQKAHHVDSARQTRRQ